MMTGQFGRKDNALESTQRQLWLDAIMRVMGFNPGNSARTMTTAHGGVTGTSPSQALGSTAWGAALATVGFHTFNLRIFNLRTSNPNKLIVYVFLTRCRISMCQSLGPKKNKISKTDRTIARTAPAGWRIRMNNGCATRTRASGSGAVAARPTLTRSGGGMPSEANPLPLCPLQNTTASLSLPPGATKRVGDATPHMARGRRIRKIPTDATLRGTARATTAAPEPLALATTGKMTTATAATGAQHAAEAESRASGRGPVPRTTAEPQGARPQGDRGSQTTPAGSSLPAAENAQHQIPADAEAQGDDGDAPHEDMDQEGAGS